MKINFCFSSFIFCPTRKSTPYENAKPLLFFAPFSYPSEKKYYLLYFHQTNIFFRSHEIKPPQSITISIYVITLASFLFLISQITIKLIAFAHLNLARNNPKKKKTVKSF